MTSSETSTVRLDPRATAESDGESGDKFGSERAQKEHGEHEKSTKFVLLTGNGGHYRATRKRL